jgi:lipoprotein-anchoring transpeptidase ErfK/SrfK
MFWLRVFALGLLLAPATSAFAAPLMPSSTPTMEDVDPGIDHTGRDRDLPSPELRRQSVYYRTEQPAGTIIVNTHDRFLYLIMGNGVALRYGVGVGRDGFQWGGVHNISKKAEWPDWTPPPEMIARQPYRMVNEDVTDLYSRVPVGTKVMASISGTRNTRTS